MRQYDLSNTPITYRNRFRLGYIIQSDLACHVSSVHQLSVPQPLRKLERNSQEFIEDVVFGTVQRNAAQRRATSKWTPMAICPGAAFGVLAHDIVEASFFRPVGDSRDGSKPERCAPESFGVLFVRWPNLTLQLTAR